MTEAQEIAICTACPLPTCNDRDRRCKISAYHRRQREAKKKAKAEIEQLKRDVLACLVRIKVDLEMERMIGRWERQTS